jgi:DNA-binding transcriptional ArsR family regulator
LSAVARVAPTKAAMTRARGEDVRRFILDHVDEHPSDIAKRAASHFHITRQAVHKHMRRLVDEGALTEAGQTRNREYKLAPRSKWEQTYRIEAALAEDIVWTRDVRPALGRLPDNVIKIWQHGFTEMFNNAIDHSEGSRIRVEIRGTPVRNMIDRARSSGNTAAKSRSKQVSRR